MVARATGSVAADPPPSPSPLAPGSTLQSVTGTQVVVSFKVAGDVSDFDQERRDDIKARLQAHCRETQDFTSLRAAKKAGIPSRPLPQPTRRMRGCEKVAGHLELLRNLQRHL